MLLGPGKLDKWRKIRMETLVTKKVSLVLAPIFERYGSKRQNTNKSA